LLDSQGRTMIRLMTATCTSVCLIVLAANGQTKSDSGKQTAGKSAADKKKALANPIPGYERRVIEGFDVLLGKEVLENNDSAKFKRKPADVLELELNTICRSLPPRTVKLLRTIVIWVEWEDKDDPDFGKAVAKYYGVWGNRAMWSLREGKHPLKANNVEIINMRKLTREHQPSVKFERCVLLHELSHAVHTHIFGSNNRDIKAAYQQAMERGLYDESKDVYGKTVKPYASTNEHEYFAELSCAYLNKLHYFPNTREDLKKHDPTGYKMMELTWGKPKQIEAALKVEVEKASSKRLDAARKLQTNGKKAEAVVALQKLLDYYPNTKAAAEAKPLLEKLKD